MVKQILDFSENNGLVLCNNLDHAQNSYERLYLFEVKKLDAHAVFFRRLFKSTEDTTPYKSEPSVCIFLEEQIPINSKRHFEIHAALWSEGKIDIYIILKGNTRLEIYNVKKPAEKVGEELSLKNLVLASESIKSLDKVRFSAKLFGQGTFWEQKENQVHINIDKSPYRHLVDYLMNVRKKFSENKEYDLSQEAIDKLLVLTILIKFLEEKKDTLDDRSTLDEIYAKYSLKSIEDIQRGSQLLSVIEDLSNEFNGKIFDQFTPDEKSKIRNTNLSLLSKFLKADVEINTGQLFFWRQYSFQHLPAEVISAIYENFIQAEAQMDGTGREKGVVYTPIHLVNFLIDEAMPLDKPPQSFIEKGEYKILDPTCGSGVFLVAAFKRLLQWWAILENQRSGKIAYPNVSTAQKILEDNIFGVDVKATAVRVTIFGLTTALLDFLTPKEVWRKLKFRDLTYRNIVRANPPTGFFKWALDAKNQGMHFSLAIGNPPFNPEKKVKKEQVLDEKIIKGLDLKHKNIPRKNFALHFFETSILLADRICMIIPSNVLLYDKSANGYRRDLFSDYSIKHIYDFTHLRRGLFTNADTPVLALIGSNVLSNFEPIIHTIVKRTISAEQRARFEIDDYDIHHVKWEWAVDPEKQLIWKTNLLGGGRLFHFVNRLKKFKTFKKFISENNWPYSVGYKLEGSNKTPNIEYLHNKEVIDTNSFNESGYKTFIELSSDFSEPRNEKIYTPPHLIFKVNLGKNHIPIHYSERYLGFKDKLVGIHCSYEQKDNLLEIYNRFINPFFSEIVKFWCLSTSSETLINLETTCKKEDIDSLPYPEQLQDLRLSDEEKILVTDILQYYTHLGKAITKSYGGAILHQPANEKQLVDYGNVLCVVLNDIYERDDYRWQCGKVFKTDSFTVFQIGFGIKGDMKYEFTRGDLDENIEALINNEASNRGATYRRVVRLYDHTDGFDCIYFIKPNALRYWLKSIALRDADETFMDLRREGY